MSTQVYFANKTSPLTYQKSFSRPAPNSSYKRPGDIPKTCNTFQESIRSELNNLEEFLKTVKIALPLQTASKLSTCILTFFGSPNRNSTSRMAFSSSESASIETASSITRIIHLEGHHTPPPKFTNSNHMIQNGEGRRERVEDLSRISSEKSLSDGQPIVQAADAPILSGSNSEYLPQIFSIAAIGLDWDEEGTSCDPAPQMKSPLENGHLVQVESLSEPAVPNDNVLQSSAMNAHMLRNHPSPESSKLLRHDQGTTPLSLPGSLPPLDQGRDVIDIEDQLEDLRLEILSGLFVSYVPLRAKPTLLDSDEDSFLLKKKAKEFLESDRRVLLLLGDSGSGKSTSLRQLHRELWTNYQPGDRIPLYIDLPFIERPEHDLIEKQLRRHNFLNYTVQELLNHRQFTILCDGYDECGLVTNLYATNQLSQQDVKMVISCRSTFLGPDYQGRFLPYGTDRYHDKPMDLFEEAVIVPLSECDIKSFVIQYVLELEIAGPLSDQPSWTAEDFMNAMSNIPNMLSLAKNPFLLTLALKLLPSQPRDVSSATQVKVTRLKLFDNFLNHWIRVNKDRLHRTIRCRKVYDTFEILCEPDFESSVTRFLLSLTAALSHHQTRRPVVVNYEHSKDGKTWKAEFFGRKIKSILLRDASPLTRAGIQYRFIHDSLFAYLRSRLVYDPDAGDDDDSDSTDDDEEDSDESDNDSDNSDGGDDSGDSSNGGHDAHAVDGITFHTCGSGSSGGGGGTSAGNYDSSGDNDGSLGGGGDSGFNQCSSGNGGSSREGKDDSGGDENNPRQSKDDSRAKKKGRSAKSRPFTSSDPLLNQNLYQDPEVLEFLVERAQSDPRFKSRLLTVIEKSKASDNYSLAAANAITILIKSGILLKSGEQFHDVDLEGVRVPSDYLSEESSELVQTAGSLTGVELVNALSAPDSNSHSKTHSHLFGAKVKAHSSSLPPAALHSYVSSIPSPLSPSCEPYSLADPFFFLPSDFQCTADILLSSSAGSSSSTVFNSNPFYCGSTIADVFPTPHSTPDFNTSVSISVPDSTIADSISIPSSTIADWFVFDIPASTISGSISAPAPTIASLFPIPASTISDSISAPAPTIASLFPIPASTISDSISVPASTIADSISAPASTIVDSISTPASTISDSISTPASTVAGSTSAPTSSKSILGKRGRSTSFISSNDPTTSKKV
ncbi:hypothetical protein BGZ89_001772 [Linnemannia elongata]|nr:hypothetical protein BGZ89_001772 [Linnemannia elongata]